MLNILTIIYTAIIAAYIIKWMIRSSKKRKAQTRLALAIRTKKNYLESQDFITDEAIEYKIPKSLNKFSGQPLNDEEKVSQTIRGRYLLYIEMSAYIEVMRYTKLNNKDRGEIVGILKNIDDPILYNKILKILFTEPLF